MNQNAIFNWFQDKRIYCEDFFSVKEVEAEAEKIGVYKGSIRGMIIKLYAWGYLEVDNQGVWCRRFRLKRNFICTKEKEVISPLSKNITAKELKKLE